MRKSRYRTCEYLGTITGEIDGTKAVQSQCTLKNPDDCPHDIEKCIVGLPDQETLRLWRIGGFTNKFVRRVETKGNGERT